VRSERVPLGRLTSSVSGRAGENSSLPVYSVTKHRGFVPSVEYFKKQVFAKDLSTYKVVEPDQFAYATIHLDEGSIGFAPESCLVSPMYTVFAVDYSLVDRDYLFAYLKSPRALASYANIGRGSAERRRSISLEALGRVTIPLPPLPEQRRIASILDQATELRAKSDTQLEFVAEASSSIFIAMFGDPIVTSKTADVVALDEVTEAVIDCPHTTPVWTESGVLCLRTSNLGAGDWDWSESRYVSNETHELRTKRAKLLAGDIILSREGTIGVSAIVQSGMIASMGQRLVQIRPSAQHVLPEFLLAYLLVVLQPSRLTQLLVGSTSRHLNVRDIRKLRIAVPPIPRQLQFSRAMESIRRHQRAVEAQSTMLEELLESIRHRAFRGEL